MGKGLLLFLSYFVLILELQAKDSHKEIIWDTVNYPPSLISEGPYKNQGFSDMSRELFMFKLPAYKHEMENGTIQKTMQDIESEQNFCFVGLTRDKFKDEFIHFSKPFLEILPNQLVIRTKDLKRFKSYVGQKGNVNLHRLLQNSGFNFGYVKNRKYTPFIDRLLLINEDKKHLLIKEIDEDSSSIVQMLDRENFDYTIEYPTVVSYIKQDKNLEKEFSSFLIRSADKLVKLHVGCSKNDFGKKVIKQVDAVIDSNLPMFESFYRTWLDYDSKKQYSEFNAQ